MSMSISRDHRDWDAHILPSINNGAVRQKNTLMNDRKTKKDHALNNQLQAMLVSQEIAKVHGKNGESKIEEEELAGHAELI